LEYSLCIDNLENYLIKFNIEHYIMTLLNSLAYLMSLPAALKSSRLVFSVAKVLFEEASLSLGINCMFADVVSQKRQQWRPLKKED